MVGTVGIEPMTSCMSSMRSNQAELRPRMLPEYNNTLSPFCKAKNS